MSDDVFCFIHGRLCNVNLLDAPAEIAAQYAALPENLAAARKMMAESAFMRESLPAHLFAAYTE